MIEDLTKYSDGELFSMLRAGEKRSEAAFGELYARHSQRIYAYCLRVVGSGEDANDVFQDTFSQFYKAAQTKKPLDNAFGYLLTIARNNCLNYKRDKKKTISLDNFDFHTNDRAYEQKEMLELVSRALQCLSFEYREAFILRMYQGLSYDEIAKICGATIPAVRSRVWRAKEKVKEILEPYYEDINEE